MRQNKSAYLLILATPLIPLLVSTIVLWHLRELSVEQQRLRLTEIVTSQARLIESIADSNTGKTPDEIENIVSRQVIQAHENFEGVGYSGEFTLGFKTKDGMIDWILNHRHTTMDHPPPVAWDNNKAAEPMRRALSGLSDTCICPDYRGEDVLAAYEPIANPQWGIVAKMDIAEVYLPFRRNGIILFGTFALFYLLASIYYIRNVGRLSDTVSDHERYLDAIVESAAQGIITITSKGRIESFNKTAEEMFGYTQEEVIGQNINMLMPNPYRRNHDTYLEKYAKTGITSIIGLGREILGQRKDGTVFPVYLSVSEVSIGNSVVFTGFVTDLTEQLDAQDKLKELNEQLEAKVQERTKSLLDAQRDSDAAHRIAKLGHWEFILEDDVFSISENASRLLEQGDSPCDIPVYIALSWMNEKDGASFTSIMQKLPENDEPMSTTVSIKTKGMDKARIFQIRAERMVDEYGKPKALLGTLQDITDITEMKEELKEKDLHLQQSQKMEAVGRLAGGIAHDFNNLLTAIIGYSEMMSHNPDMDDRQSRDVGRILDAGLKAKELTSQLLSFSRKQVLEPQIVDLGTIVKSARDILERVIGEDVEMTIQLDSSIESVFVDPGKIEQALMNLVINARDAMPNGGTIEIFVRNITLKAKDISPESSLTAGNYVLLSVCDTGMGMDQDTMDKVLEPFFTTKELNKGTGLGLAMVYGTVQQSGGDLIIKSELDKGSQFNIYLPQFDGDTEELKEADESILEPAKGSETILLVEDDTSMRQVLERVLVTKGYKVLVAPDPEEALSQLDVSDRDVSLLLTDVIMPKSDGKQLANEVQKIRPEIKVLFMSGYDEERISSRGVSSEGVNFIAKPFRISDILTRIRSILDSN